MTPEQNILNNRPALAAACAMAVGIFTAKLLNASWIVFVSISVVCISLSLIEVYIHRKDSARSVLHSFTFLLTLFFASAASYSINVRLQENNHITHFVNTTDSLAIVGRVIDEPKAKEGRTTLLISILSLENEFDSIATEGRVYLTIFADKRSKEQVKEIPYGSILTFNGILQEPAAERNPGEFSYKEYLSLNNVHALTTVFGYSRVTISEFREPNWFFEQIIFPSKEFIVRTITTVMKGDEANFLIGLLLGDRTDISEEIKKAFTNTGTIHVLAVSGSHVILVVTIIYIVLGLLRFPNRPKILLTLLALVYYTFLTGASPSIVRASIMSGIVLVGKFFEQKTDSYNVLGLSAVLMFLYDPKQLFDVGFQLSFSAVFSMVYFYPKLNSIVKNIPEPLEEFKIITPVWQLFALSLAAQIGTIPFTAYYFGKVSLISLFANLLVVPLVGVIVTIGLTGALLGVVSMWIASVFSEANNLLSWFTLTFVKLAEQVPYAVVNTATFGWKETIVYSLIITWMFNQRNRVLQKRILFSALVFATGLLYSSVIFDNEKKLRVTFLDVGQGDAAVIELPSGETILVDAGPISASFNAGEKIVAPYLRRRGIPKIDALITSHPHADHLGGVPYLMKHFDVNQTIDADQRLNSKLFYEYDALEKKVNQVTARAGMANRFDNVRIYFLHPTGRFIDADSTDGYSDVNESSVVFKMHYGVTSFLFMGDAEIESEEQIVHVYHDFLDSDVLKAGHHGSSTSSTEQLVTYSNPEHVVVSVARFNKFKHPSKAVLQRFDESGAKIYRTDREGAVIFESDGTTIQRVPWRNEQ
ncbi:MAG: DNA internalization-related competence protein ComEC/Rec2 [Ignavibacteriales bacterium]|nr:DNA internalization-related competence protein ComEC/Rec2 [Ignavibacteriales bacterium]